MPPPKAPEPAPQAAAAAAAAAAVAAVAAKAAQAAQAVQSAPTANPILPSAMGSSGPATVTAAVTPAVRPLSAPVPAPPPTAPVASAPAAPAAVPVPAAPAPASGPNDFTRIRAIDGALQTALHGLGVRSFADIANWKPDDVARISSALKIPGRIEQENWIEQAQILAKGGETYYSRRKAQSVSLSRPTPDEGERLTIRVPAATRPAEAAAPPSPAMPAPAAATPVTAPPAPAPSTEALKSAAAAAAAAVQAAQAAVSPVAPAVAASATAAPAAPTAAPAPAPAAPAADTPVAASAASAPAVGLQRDPLQRIAGINAEVERLLNVQGVTRFSQIASWSPSDISRFDRLLGFEGRIARENWIEQANILSKGGETAYARDLARRAGEALRPAKLADAIQSAAAAAQSPPVVPAAAAAVAAAVQSAQSTVTAAAEPVRSELSALRSVRSEAYRGTDAGAPHAGRAPDDLKRIRGVGVLIEKKLNGLGVTRYEQIANWTAADIERFSDKLDFKGRIERENWVEQARILSAGGQTEFSQRVDRGEVETSRRLD